MFKKEKAFKKKDWIFCLQDELPANQIPSLPVEPLGNTSSFPVSCFLFPISYLQPHKLTLNPDCAFAAVRRELHQTLTGFKPMEKPSDCPRNAAQPAKLRADFTCFNERHDGV